MFSGIACYFSACHPVFTSDLNCINLRWERKLFSSTRRLKLSFH